MNLMNLMNQSGKWPWLQLEHEFEERHRPHCRHSAGGLQNVPVAAAWAVPSACGCSHKHCASCVLNSPAVWALSVFTKCPWLQPQALCDLCFEFPCSLGDICFHEVPVAAATGTSRKQTSPRLQGDSKHKSQSACGCSHGHFVKTDNAQTAGEFKTQLAQCLWLQPQALGPSECACGCSLGGA